jgi:broad specificity phosphatase PhoE
LELYLIRHGQAGSRQNYDQLSSLGMEQAALLAAWFDSQDIRFDRVYSGGLVRQRLTAEHLHPSPTPLPEWNEFDLDAVYGEIAPLLSEKDEAFARHYAETLAQQNDPSHPIHRQWHPADMGVVLAWVSGQFPTRSESWLQFTARIQQAFAALPNNHERIAVVTSATPIGITTGRIFNTPPAQYLQLAGAIHNTAFTRLRFHNGSWRLEAFNHTPHLPAPSHRTLR